MVRFFPLKEVLTQFLGDLDTVKQMLEDGADPDRNNWMNQTVLHEATERGECTGLFCYE